MCSLDSEATLLVSSPAIVLSSSTLWAIVLALPPHFYCPTSFITFPSFCLGCITPTVCFFDLSTMEKFYLFIYFFYLIYDKETMQGLKIKVVGIQMELNCWAKFCYRHSCRYWEPPRKASVCFKLSACRNIKQHLKCSQLHLSEVRIGRAASDCFCNFPK